MDRATRDKFATRTDQADLTTGNACWQTAPLVFLRLNEDFGRFDIDICGDALRALCSMWFGPQSPVGEYDALTAAWSSYGTNGFDNPPYGPFVQKILAKAKAEADQGFTSLHLLPLRVTGAFRAHVLNGAARLIFPDTRLTFFENGLPRCGYDKRGKVRADPAMFDSILVQYLPGAWDRPRLGEWHVPPHVTKDDLDRWVALNPIEQWREQQKVKKAA
jgi:hypothetical protein